MQYKKEFLLDFPVFFGEAVAEIRQEGFEIGYKEGLEIGHKEGQEIAKAELGAWLPKAIINAHQMYGFTAKQLSEGLEYPLEYIQSVLDTLKKE